MPGPRINPFVLLLIAPLILALGLAALHQCTEQAWEWNETIRATTPST